MSKLIRRCLVTLYILANIPLYAVSLNDALTLYRDELQSVDLPGESTYGIAYDGTDLWAVDSETDELYRIGEDRSPELQCTLQIKEWPSDLCWDEGTLYVNAKGRIYQADIDTGKCTKLFQVEASEPYGVVGLTTDGDYFYSVDRIDKVIRKYSRPDFTLIATFPLDFDHEYIRCITYYDGYLWLLNSSKDWIHRIDPDTGVISGYFFAPSIGYPRGLEFADGKWWISDSENCKLIPTIMEEISNGMRSNPQEVSVTFNHYVSNNYPVTLDKIEVYSAVPMNTARQEIIAFTEITMPTSYATDAFGQNLAYYLFTKIPANSHVLVQWQADAVLWDIKYFVESVGETKDIPTDIRNTFLSDHEYLGLTTPKIAQLAKKAAKSATNLLHLALLCRNAAYDTLEYDNDHNWLSAPEVVEAGKGSCSEYSLLISALCRANGIPTRFVGSTRFREKDLTDSGTDYGTYVDTIYHRWVEVYIPDMGWMPVESTSDDEDDGNHDIDKFMGYDNFHLALSKTFIDDNYLGINYHSSYKWSSSGRASGKSGSVEKSRYYLWKVYK